MSIALPADHPASSIPIPLRLLFAAQPKLVTPVLQVVHRVITRFLLGLADLAADQADSAAVRHLCIDIDGRFVAVILSAASVSATGR